MRLGIHAGRGLAARRLGEPRMARIRIMRWLYGATLLGATAGWAADSPYGLQEPRRPIVLKVAGKPDLKGTVLKADTAANGDKILTVHTETGDTVKVVEPSVKPTVAITTKSEPTKIQPVGLVSEVGLSSTVIPGSCECAAEPSAHISKTPAVSPVPVKPGIVNRLFGHQPTAAAKPTVTEYAPPIEEKAQAEVSVAPAAVKPGRVNLSQDEPGISVIRMPAVRASVPGTVRINPVSTGFSGQGASADRMLAVLKEALQPSHREQAVAALAPMAAKSASIRQDLCEACASDPAPDRPSRLRSEPYEACFQRC